MGMWMLLLELAVFLALFTSSSSLATDDGPIIGVDFGTFGSSVGVFRDGEVEMIHNQFGKLVTPSWAHFGDGVLAVGDIAADLALRFPHIGNAMFGVKRFLGLNVSEAVQNHWLIHLLATEYGSNKTIIRGQSRDKSRFYDLPPEFIAGFLLSTVKKTAELHLGSKITSAVISVPGVYGHTQRQAIIDAATIGGFKTIRLINDPTSIALAYGTSRIEGKKVLVIDFGGSTVDVAVLAVDNGNVHVLGGGGSFSLGGLSFDYKLMLFILDQVKELINMNPFHDFQSVLKSWNACEAAKIALSKVESTTIEIQLEDQSKAEYEISVQISRDQFEFLIKDEMRAVEDLILHAIEKASLDIKDIDMVLMAGGSSQVPKVKQLLFSLFKGKKVVFLEKDKSVAYGAAIYGANLNGQLGTKGNQMHETTQWSVGVEVESVFKPVFKENDVIPAAKSVLLHTPIANVTVYERFSDGHRDYTHRLGSITLPNTRNGNINVAMSVDANGMLQMHDGWNIDAAERVLDRDLVSKCINTARAYEYTVAAPIADDGTGNSFRYNLDVQELLSQGVINQATADILQKYGELGVEDAVTQGVLTREKADKIERIVKVARLAIEKSHDEL